MNGSGRSITFVLICIKALSIVLAGLVIILPVEQVLAQAAQQEAGSVQQTPPPDAAANLFRVPPLTPNSLRLLGTSSDRALLDTDFADDVWVQHAPQNPLLGWWNRLGTLEKVGVVLGTFVVVGATWGGIAAAGENNNPDSFKSSHTVVGGIGIGALVGGVFSAALFGVVAQDQL